MELEALTIRLCSSSTHHFGNRPRLPEIIAIGYGYGAANRPDLKTFNHVSLHVLGPLLVFTSLAGEDFQLQGNARVHRRRRGGDPRLGADRLACRPVGTHQSAHLRAAMMFNNCGNMGLRWRCSRSGARGWRRWC